MNSHNTSIRYRLTFALLLAAAAGMFFLVKGFSAGAGQAQGKLVDQQRFENEPVEVVEVKAKGKRVKIGKRFDDDDDWVKGMAWTVKNTSSKPITYMAVSLDFPETKSSGNVMTFTLRYGQNLRAPALSGEPIYLMPGDTMPVALSDLKYEELQKFIELRHPVKSLREVSLRMFEVRFADGTVWSGGSFFKPDPNNSKKLVPVEEPSGAWLKRWPLIQDAAFLKDTAAGEQVAFTTLGYAKSTEGFLLAPRQLSGPTGCYVPLPPDTVPCQFSRTDGSKCDG